MSRNAFTLIELLIVVAIISILASIAVPNFMEAQARSKVSRARTDMRTLATALETYVVDNNRYPPNWEYGGERLTPSNLSSPISYLTSLPSDPFRTSFDYVLRRYDYHNVQDLVDRGESSWPPNDLRRYGLWRFVSYGPKGEYLPWIPYDSTNGTMSAGNVLRTHLSPEGRIGYDFWDPANPYL